MLENLSGTEIIDIAKKIETWGVAFYDEASKQVKDEEASKLFAFLREEEKRHEKQFERLLGQGPQTDAEWRDNEEYAGYMRALAENIVFPEPSEAKKMVETLGDEAAVLARAIEFEKESLLYFHEIHQLVQEEFRGLVDGLIKEERKHLRLLRDLHRIATQA